MSEGLSSTDNARALLNDAGWGEVADRLLRGVGHAVNGRAATLASWIDLSETGSVETKVLEPEVDKLTALAKQVSAIVVGSDQPAEVLLLGEVLEQTVPVHHMHRGLESVGTEVEREGSPTAIRTSGRIPSVSIRVGLSTGMRSPLGPTTRSRWVLGAV